MRYYPAIVISGNHYMLALAEHNLGIEGRESYYGNIFNCRRGNLEEYRIRLDDVSAEYLNTNYMVFLWDERRTGSLGIGRVNATSDVAVCTDRYRGFKDEMLPIRLLLYFIKMAEPEEKIKQDVDYLGEFLKR